MRKLVLLFAVASLTAGAAQAIAAPKAATGEQTPALAVTPASYTGAAARAEAPRQLYICNEDEGVRLVAPAADYGFVTAKQVLAGRTWSGAKCITASEARKLFAAK